MKTKKVLIALLCVLALMLGACSKADNKVENQHGEEFTVTDETVQVGTEGGDYEPYTITLNLERSGIGQNMEETFTSAPVHAIASGDHMAGFTRGSCWSTVSEYPARDTVHKMAPDGTGLAKVSKEDIIATGCDFMMGWDSLFSDNNFSVSFCLEHGIIPYFPYCCSDSATFEDIYKDYEVLGNVFGVQEVAAEKVQAMKDKLDYVKETLGEEAMRTPFACSCTTPAKTLRSRPARACPAT